MTNKQKRDYIKYECDNRAVKAYLKSQGLEPDSLKIDIRYDGYISQWNIGFTGDIVSYMYDVIHSGTDLYDTTDEVYEFMKQYNDTNMESRTLEELTVNKIAKARSIASVCISNRNKMLKESPNKLKKLLYSLVPREVWDLDAVNSNRVLEKFIGVDNYGDIAIILPETVVIKHPRNIKMKWQSFGSRSYIPYSLNDTQPVYILFGMKEILLMELLQLNYLVFQSDSMVKHLKNAHKELLKNRDVVIVPDNDLSCFKAATTLSNSIVTTTNTIRYVNSLTNNKEDLVDYVTQQGVKKTLELLKID